MQQLVILLIINCSWTCFGRLYAHHQEVRLRFTAYGFLFYCNCCDAEGSGWKLCALCGVGCLFTRPVVVDVMQIFGSCVRHKVKPHYYTFVLSMS